jgi:hypothetical protein
VLLDPASNLGQMLVLLADVILLAKVDEKDNGLGREEEERVDDLNLESCKLVLKNRYDSQKGGWCVESEMDVFS